MKATASSGRTVRTAVTSVPTADAPAVAVTSKVRIRRAFAARRSISSGRAEADSPDNRAASRGAAARTTSDTVVKTGPTAIGDSHPNAPGSAGGGRCHRHPGKGQQRRRSVVKQPPGDERDRRDRRHREQKARQCRHRELRTQPRQRSGHDSQCHRQAGISSERHRADERRDRRGTPGTDDGGRSGKGVAAEQHCHRCCRPQHPDHRDRRAPGRHARIRLPDSVDHRIAEIELAADALTRSWQSGSVTRRRTRHTARVFEPRRGRRHRF